MSSVKGLKSVYDTRNNGMPAITGVTATAQDTDFKEQMKAVKRYWQTSTTKGRSGSKVARSDGTMKNTEAMMYSLKRKLGCIEFTDEWVNMAAERMQDDGMNPGSMNAYMLSVSRWFEALGHTVEVPQWNYVPADHFHYSISSMDRLLKAANAKSVVHGAVMAFLYYQAPRVGELCNLKMENLNLDTGEVSIFGQKNHKWRTIPLDSRVMPALNKWLELRENSVVPFLREHNMRVPNTLFLNRFGGAFKARGIEVIVNAIAQRVGFEGKELDEAHPHTLRHTWAYTHLHDSGVNNWDIASVAFYLGDNIATVEKYYAHTGTNNCRKLMERMNGGRY